MRFNYNITRLAEAVGIPTSTAYHCVAVGSIPAPTIKVGKRAFYERKVFEELVRQLKMYRAEMHDK